MLSEYGNLGITIFWDGCDPFEFGSAIIYLLAALTIIMVESTIRILNILIYL